MFPIFVPQFLYFKAIFEMPKKKPPTKGPPPTTRKQPPRKASVAPKMFSAITRKKPFKQSKFMCPNSFCSKTCETMNAVRNHISRSPSCRKIFEAMEMKKSNVVSNNKLPSTSKQEWTKEAKQKGDFRIQNSTIRPTICMYCIIGCTAE